MSTTSDNVRYARLCHIVKWEDFDGYGFNLHAEKGKNGQFIGKVDEGSPSEAAGLKQGDRIVEVNEINIANETHKQVVERIKAFPNETKLLVVDQEADDYFKEHNIVIKGSMTNVKVTKTPERSPVSEADSACARSVGSDSSVDENTHKSISSTNTTNSGSTVAAMVENSVTEEPRENMNGNGNAVGEQKGLNLKMSAKELRAQLAARKKYDPKKESLGFKDKFDIVQKL